MFTRVPDAELMSLAFGQGARTIVAVGGWIGPGELWLESLGHLAGRWRAITYDHRGAGATLSAPASITLDALVDDLFAVMDAHRVERCVLAAESMGAGVAMQALLRHPERFTGLVTIGGNWVRPQPGQYDALIAGVRRDFAATVAAFVDRCVPEPGRDAVRHWGRQMLMRSTPEHAVRLLQSKSALTVQDRLHEIQVPALILHGSLDAVVPPALSQQLAQRLRTCRLEVMEGLGHVPCVTEPLRVAQAIDDFFAGSSGARATGEATAGANCR
jgi:3-oxoadipate enol-lactonase